MLVLTYSETTMLHSASTAETVLQATESSWDRVVALVIVADRARSLSSVPSAPSQITLVCLPSAQNHWMLLRGFQYLATSVMGWNKFRMARDVSTYLPERYAFLYPLYS